MRLPVPVAAGAGLLAVALVTLVMTTLHIGRSDLYVGGSAGAPNPVRATPTSSGTPSQFAVFVPPSPAATSTPAPAAAPAAPAPKAPAPGGGGRKKH